MGHKKKCKNADNYVPAVMKGLTDNELETSSEIGVEVDWVLSEDGESARQHCYSERISEYTS